MPNRHLRAKFESSDFDCEKVQVRRVVGREAISKLYDYEIELVFVGTEGPGIDAMLGAGATLVWERDGNVLRKVHGVLSSVDDRLDGGGGHRSFVVRLVPRAHALGLVETFDIVLDASVPEIVETKLKLCGLGTGTDFGTRLIGSYDKRDFVVQYGETDLAFVSRLTEHLGIAFCFEHGDDKDTMVFTDHAAGFAPMAGGGTIRWQGGGAGTDLYELELTKRLIPSVYVVRDYNYRTPTVDLSETVEATGGSPGGVVEYGPHFKTPDQGKALARIRAEEREATAVVYTGKCAVPTVAAGATMEVQGHPSLTDTTLLVTEVLHEVTQVVMAVSGSDEHTYRSSFRAIPAGRMFRPARATPKPKIQGLVTGVVEDPNGGSGDHAGIDAEGRYVVRFLFDTAGHGERQASHRVRQVQTHAGANYGMHFPLRPGTEVVLAFVNGDPDRPIIVGAVPNPLTATPVKDVNRASNVIKTASGIVFNFNDSFKRS